MGFRNTLTEVKDKIQSIINTEFSKYVPYVILYCIFTDKELIGNWLVTVALNNKI